MNPCLFREIAILVETLNEHIIGIIQKNLIQPVGIHEIQPHDYWIFSSRDLAFKT